MKQRNKYFFILIIGFLTLSTWLMGRKNEETIKPKKREVITYVEKKEVTHEHKNCHHEHHQSKKQIVNKSKEELLNKKFEKNKSVVYQKYYRHIKNDQGSSVEVNIIRETKKRLHMRVSSKSEKFGENNFIAVVDKNSGKVIATHSRTTHENPKYVKNLRLSY